MVGAEPLLRYGAVCKKIYTDEVCLDVYNS